MRQGFTLAEVLITLAIIGVVAALTIPTVVRNYQKTQYAAGLKKAYSEIRRIHDQILFENGGYDPIFDITDLSPQNVGKYCDENWAPKMKVLKKCKDAMDCGYTSNTSFKQLNVERTPISGHISQYKCGYILPDGSLFDLLCYNYTNESIVYTVDLNGAKQPNILGVDVFQFYLSKTDQNYNTIKPRGYARQCPVSYCNPKATNTDGAGAFCSARVLKCDGGEIKYNW